MAEFSERSQRPRRDPLMLAVDRLAGPGPVGPRFSGNPSEGE